MKKYLIIILIVICFPFVGIAEKVIIKGKIYHSGTKMNMFTIDNFQFSTQKRKILFEIKTELETEGYDSFYTEIDCLKPQVIQIFLKNIFIQPGDTIDVNYYYDFVQGGYFKDSMIVNFVNPLNILFYDKLANNKIYETPDCNNEKYFKRPDIYKQDVSKYFDSIICFIKANKNKFSNAFFQYLQKDLLFRKMQMLCLPIELELYRKEELSADYFSIFRLLPKNDSSLIDMLSYCYSLFLHVTLVEYKGNRNQFDIVQFSSLLSKISIEHKGIVKDYLMLAICNWYYYKAEPEVIRETKKEIEKYLDNFSNIVYRKAIEENYPFQFTQNGDRLFSDSIKNILLQDYDGKVYKFSTIYVPDKLTYADIWATSCPPCIKEIPVSLKLFDLKYKTLLSNIYISMDDDFAKWINISQRLGIPKEKSFIILNKFDRDYFERYFNVLSFPHYVLFKGDKVLNYNMPRISNAELLDNELLFYLKENKEIKNLPPPPKFE